MGDIFEDVTPKKHYTGSFSLNGRESGIGNKVLFADSEYENGKTLKSWGESSAEPSQRKETDKQKEEDMF